MRRMTRRSRLAACLVALVAVGWLVVGVEPRSSALASDPILDAKAQLASVSAQYQKVADVLSQVKQEVADVQGQLAALNHQIATLDTQLKQIATDIVTQTGELAAREALLQAHL